MQLIIEIKHWLNSISPGCNSREITYFIINKTKLCINNKRFRVNYQIAAFCYSTAIRTILQVTTMKFLVMFCFLLSLAVNIFSSPVGFNEDTLREIQENSGNNKYFKTGSF